MTEAIFATILRGVVLVFGAAFTASVLGFACMIWTDVIRTWRNR